MLFKSNKFFDLKSKKTSVKLVKSINLCQFLNFLLHITGKSCHILRFTYIRVSHSGGGRVGAPPPHLTIFFRKPPLSNFEELPCLEHLGKLCICETQVHNCTESIIFGIPHPKVL